MQKKTPNTKCQDRRWLKIVLLTLLICGSLLPKQLYAAPVVNEAYFFERKNRLEVSGSFDSLSPNATYGNWQNVSVSFYRKERKDLVWFAMLESFSRNEGGATLATLGAYKDWNAAMYTYTSISTGTNSSYLQKFRIDHDFNFKFGKENQLILTAGGSFIQYYSDYRDYILTLGLTKHINSKLAVGYQVFRNVSQPGSVESYSHQFSVDYGKERQQLTSLIYSFGTQAYLPAGLVSPAALVNPSQLISLKHRRWLGKDRDYGYFVEINYFNLQENYSSIGALIGYFREY